MYLAVHLKSNLSSFYLVGCPEITLKMIFLNLLWSATKQTKNALFKHKLINIICFNMLDEFSNQVEEQLSFWNVSTDKLMYKDLEIVTKLSKSCIVINYEIARCLQLKSVKQSLILHEQ